MVAEPVQVVPYDPSWPRWFAEERDRLFSDLPPELVRRIEHFGSTAVPGLPAKPVVDILVEVADLEATRERIAPLLQGRGYEYFWRPTSGDDGPPFYAWFVRRDAWTGARTHHIHMVEAGFTSHWDRLLFRDYLIDRAETARAYGRLKLRLAGEFPRDRVAYTRAKSEFVERVTAEAKDWYRAVSLRPVRDEDLPTFFRHQADPVAAAMAGFQPRERGAFEAHWAKLRVDASGVTRAVLLDRLLVGNVLGFDSPDGREVGYWIGREHWGRGIATRALRAFLRVETTRPLLAHVVRSNAASLRVLSRCGFETWVEDRDDVVLRLPGSWRSPAPGLY